VFRDELKGERWIFKPEKVFKTMTLKSVGQEEQYYFPIDICKKEKFEPKPELVFDSVRQVYVEVPIHPQQQTLLKVGVRKAQAQESVGGKV